MHVFLRGIIWWSLATHEFTLGIPNLPQHFEYSSESSSRKWSNRMPVRMIKSIPKQGLNKHLYITHLYCYIRKILLNKSPIQHLLVIIEPETKWQPFGRRIFRIEIQNFSLMKMHLANAFSWMRSFVFRFEIHLSLFLRVQLTIIRRWFRQWLGAEHAIGPSLPTNFTRPSGDRGQGTSHYPNQCWPSSPTNIHYIYAALGEDAFTLEAK